MKKITLVLIYIKKQQIEYHTPDLPPKKQQKHNNQ